MPVPNAPRINNLTPTWTWGASVETGSGLERYLLKWSQNSDCSSGFTTTTGPSESYTIPGGILTEGRWYFCVAARDNAQNDSGYSPSGMVIIDTTPPVLTTVTPIVTPVTTTSATYYFSSTEPGIYSIQFCGANAQTTITADTSISLTNLESGKTYSCGFYVTDLAGNVSNTLQIGPFTPSFGAVIPISVLQAMSEASQTPIQNTITNVTQIKKDDEVLRTDFTFKNNMRLGSTISDVRKLQDVLKSLGSDIYPEGTVSGYFGPLTYKAVVRFQEKYFDEILAPLGNKKGTGVVGEYTRKKLNSILLK